MRQEGDSSIIIGKAPVKELIDSRALEEPQGVPFDW